MQSVLEKADAAFDEQSYEPAAEAYSEIIKDLKGKAVREYVLRVEVENLLLTCYCKVSTISKRYRANTLLLRYTPSQRAVSYVRMHQYDEACIDCAAAITYLPTSLILCPDIALDVCCVWLEANKNKDLKGLYNAFAEGQYWAGYAKVTEKWIDYIDKAGLKSSSPEKGTHFHDELANSYKTNSNSYKTSLKHLENLLSNGFPPYAVDQNGSSSLYAALLFLEEKKYDNRHCHAAMRLLMRCNCPGMFRFILLFAIHPLYPLYPYTLSQYTMCRWQNSIDVGS